MKKIFTLISTLALFIGTASAQNYFYLPYLNAGQNPGGLNNDIEQPGTTGWATIATTSATPVWSSTVAMPFNFNFKGSPVDSFKVSTSGVLTFTTSATSVPSSTSAALPSASIPDKSVCIWGLAGLGTNDQIRTKLFGTAPNRQFWIQFNSYSCPGSTGWTYWAIALEETSDNIYVVDQRSYNSPLALSIGIQVNSTSALSVAGSPTLGSNATTTADQTPIDNSYYQFTYGQQAAVEVQLKSLTFTNYVVAPNTSNITGTIFNNGANPITSVTIKYQVNGNTYSYLKSGLNLSFGQTYSFTHSTPFNISTHGDYPVKVWVELPGDANPWNDTLSAYITAYSFLATKRVVFEEATGTWCGWCPRGTVYMDSLMNIHNNTAMLIAVHNQDPMVVNAYDAKMGTLIGGYPSGLVDRKDNDVDPSTFIDEYNQRIQDIVACDVDVVATYNPSILLAYVTVTAHFAGDLAGDYRFNVVVTEDEVTGTSTQWDQHNYYSVQSQNIPLQGAGHNWQAEPNPILAANMSYNHVARAILGGWDGAWNSLPYNIADNSTHSFSFTYPIPATSDLSKLNFIGWVSNKWTGEIINSNAALAGQLVTSIQDNSNATFKMNVAPNPVNESNGKVYVTFKKATDVTFEVVDVLGNTVRSSYQSNINAGDYIYPLNFEGLANGIYTVRIIAGNDALTQRVILAH